MRRSILKAIILGVGITLFAGDALAGSPYFTVDYTPSGNNLIWTSQVTYSLKPIPNSGFPYVIMGYRWQYKRACNNAWSDMTATPDGASETCYEVFVGTFEVRCRLTLGDASGGPIPPPGFHDVDGATITIPPPDGIALISDDSVEAAGGERIPVYFQIKCKGKNCSMAVGYPQEKLTERKFPGDPIDVIPDSNWTPPPGQGFYFRLNGPGEIQDSCLAKNIGLKPVGVVATVKQQIRILVEDPCGNRTAYPLPPAFRKTFTKLPNGNYKITNTPIP